MNFAPLLAAGPAIHIHLAATLAALVLGAVMLLRRKGTLPHRRLGWLWAALMLTAAVSSFWIVGMTGRYSWIHGLAVVVLVTVPAAVVAARRRHTSTHRAAMLSLYFGGLIVPGLFTLLPARLLGGLVFGG